MPIYGVCWNQKNDICRNSIFPFLSCISRLLPLTSLFHFFLVNLQTCAFVESFSREPLASITWDDLWYHTFPKDSLQLKFLSITIDFHLCCRVLDTLRFHWFITAQSIKFDLTKLSIRQVDKQDCSHLAF